MPNVSDYNIEVKEFELQSHIPQSAGAVEYTDCISADSPNECPDDTKQYELRGMMSTPSLPSLPGPLWPERSYLWIK